MAKTCKTCGARYKGMEHTVFDCEERVARAGGKVAYARFLLKASEAGRIDVHESTRVECERILAEHDPYLARDHNEADGGGTTVAAREARR